MAVMMYKIGEKPIRIEHIDMAGHEALGWSIHENLEEIEVAEAKTKQEDAELLAIAALEYEQKFGKKPHHLMKLETILEKLNGNEPV